jgi:very-short-patch-repair endonuclease
VESIFWHTVVRNRKLLWYKFRRQKVVWPFILDFYCSKLLLWIELDGGYHNDNVKYDRMRDAEVCKKWILVIRFKNEDIENNLAWVVGEIEQIIKERREMFL